MNLTDSKLVENAATPDPHTDQRERIQWALLKAIPDLIIRMSRNGTCLDIMNPNSVCLYNAPALQVGNSIYEMLPYHQAQQRMEYIDLALSTAQPQAYEYQLLVEDELRYEEARIVPYSHNEVLVIVRDITERKRATQQQTLLNTLTNQIYASLDLDTILRTCLRGALQLLQADRALICQVTSDSQDLVLAEEHTADMPSLIDTFRYRGCCFDRDRLYLQGQTEAVEGLYTVAYPDSYRSYLSELGVRAYIAIPILQEAIQWGTLVVHHCQGNRIWQTQEIRWLESLAKQLSIAVQHAEIYQQVEELVDQRAAELNRALNFQSLLQQITDKLRSSLDESQIMKAIVDGLGDALETCCCDVGIYSLDLTLSTIQYENNHEMTSAVGCTISIPDSLDIHGQLLEGNYVQFCWPGEQERWPHWWGVRQHSRGLPVEVLACPIEDENGVIGDLWLSRPIHRPFDVIEIDLVRQLADQCAIALRQSRLYQETQRQIEELERLNQLKDEFVATVSHELRTPLTSLRMALKLIEMAPSEAKHQQYLKMANQQCDYEIALVNDLLTLQKLSSGHFEPHYQTVDLQEWLPSICEPFVEIASSQNQDLKLFYPALSHRLTIDPQCLERILRELLHNACKYTPEGGQISLEIEISCGGLLMQVTNSGELEPEEQIRIFDKFYRARRAHISSQEGTGLGLALIKKLVESLEGSIQVRSQEGWIQFATRIPCELERVA